MSRDLSAFDNRAAVCDNTQLLSDCADVLACVKSFVGCHFYVHVECVCVLQ